MALKNKTKVVTYLTSNSNNLQLFTEMYLCVRKKESRVLLDEELSILPEIHVENPHFSEWLVRKKSTDRFINYLKSKKNIKSILDLGCGNGWFANLIAKTFPSIYLTGLDVNEHELEQGNRIFQQENLEFIYADIFKLESNVLEDKFDLIVLNASIQYFPDLPALFLTLKTFLKPFGEIHILDSPFYKKPDLLKAKQRTVNYYTELGFPEMANYYFHHGLENLNDFEILYQPKKSVLSKILKQQDSPFLWAKKTV